MRTTLSRVALVAAAVGVCLWLAGSLTSLNQSEDAAVALAPVAANGGDLAAITRASRGFHKAARFGDDSDLLVEQGRILIFARNARRAVPVLRRAVRREPENAEAWILLFTATRTQDPRLAQRAKARAIALDPRVKARFEGAG